jgi:hypothetical protein
LAQTVSNTLHLPKYYHWTAGEFGVVSNEMKASPIRLADDEAVERVAVKCGKRRKGDNVAFIYPSGYDQLPGG